MYAYRKCMPRANKHLDDKWVKHCQNLHRKKLKGMKAAIDNKPPPTYMHLKQNLKKQQNDEERYSQIERDNYLLLDKMSYIMTHPQLLDEKYMGPPVTCVPPAPSLRRPQSVLPHTATRGCSSMVQKRNVGLCTGEPITDSLHKHTPQDLHRNGHNFRVRNTQGISSNGLVRDKLWMQDSADNPVWPSMLQVRKELEQGVPKA